MPDDARRRRDRELNPGLHELFRGYFHQDRDWDYGLDWRVAVAAFVEDDNELAAGARGELRSFLAEGPTEERARSWALDSLGINYLPTEGFTVWLSLLSASLEEGYFERVRVPRHVLLSRNFRRDWPVTGREAGEEDVSPALARDLKAWNRLWRNSYVLDNRGLRWRDADVKNAHALAAPGLRERLAAELGPDANVMLDID